MLGLHFTRLSSATRLSESEIVRAQMYAATITSRLRRAFALVSVQTIGSHARGSSIRLHSDLDLLAFPRS